MYIRLYLIKSSYKQSVPDTTPIAPSKDYEILRRRIFLNTKELWYYISSELSLLSTGKKNIRDIDKIKNMVDEHYTSLLNDVSDLAKVDGYSTWRIKESEELSYLVKKRLDDLQNPPDCDKARKVVWAINSVCFNCIKLFFVNNSKI